MKHGRALGKFSRTTSHRDLMLRNLVTSLFEHEQIKTTLPKARDTARLAEKIITMGKQNNFNSFKRVSAFLLKPEVVPKVFEIFRPRYANRPGGYTRIHKYQNRAGDNAPTAILELVDNPRDIKTEMTARTVGWELLRDNYKTRGMKDIVKNGVHGAHQLIREEMQLPAEATDGRLRQLTRWNLQKILKFKDGEARSAFQRKAEEYVDLLLAKSLAGPQKDKVPIEGKRPAGWAIPSETPGAMQKVQGALGNPQGRTKWTDRVHIFGKQHLFAR